MWGSNPLESGQEAVGDVGQPQTADAVINHFLQQQQQQQQPGLTGEQLAALAAAAAAGSYGAPTLPDTAAAAGDGMGSAPTDMTTLPPVPDLQGLADAQQLTGAKRKAGVGGQLCLGGGA